MLAFLGKVLTVDLWTGRIEIANYPSALAERFLAGRGANAYLLCQTVPVGTDPLGPDNPLILSAGLLTGTAAPSSSRLHVGARSPLTGLLGSSNVGAHFGAELRAAGWQVVILNGRSERPVYLSIDGERVELQVADGLWGLDAWRTQSALAERPDLAGAKVLAIGPGGERLVRFACVMTERGHAAGRTGMGAVMGAKNLKAIAVRGDRREQPVSDGARTAVRAYATAIREAPRYPSYARYSNSNYVTWADELGILATRNYRQNRFEAAASIDGKRLIDYVTKPRSCHRCPVHCKAEVKIEAGRFAGTEGERPDIEPIMALGARCGIADPEAVLYLYNLCGRLGIDAISAGAALAFATDLFERGIITTADTDGLALRWGDDRSLATLLERIARREGFGDVLAEGVARAGAAIGRGAEEVAYHSKGLELTGYDPRAALATALAYAVSSRGADFTTVYPVPEFRWPPTRAEAELGVRRGRRPLDRRRQGPAGEAHHSCVSGARRAGALQGRSTLGSGRFHLAAGSGAGDRPDRPNADGRRATDGGRAHRHPGEAVQSAPGGGPGR